LQRFYRLFRAPAVVHCGGVGPQPQKLFDALVNWVEKGDAPKNILATNSNAAGVVTRSRPLCAYPQTAIYNGTGSTDDANSFHCGGNLEKPRIVRADAKYKHETKGGLDFQGSGVERKVCMSRHEDADDDHENHGHRR
jgi:hypothetical protein